MLYISGRERQRERLRPYMCSGVVVISSRPEHRLRMLRRGRRGVYGKPQKRHTTERREVRLSREEVTLRIKPVRTSKACDDAHSDNDSKDVLEATYFRTIASSTFP